MHLRMAASIAGLAKSAVPRKAAKRSFFERYLSAEHHCAPPAEHWTPISASLAATDAGTYQCPECGMHWHRPE
ncbi:MAG: hypothetical protein ABL907_17855 [Hyphomicrobium sp.]